MATIKIIDKTQYYIVNIGQAYLANNNTLSPLLTEALHFPTYNAAAYAADLWLETTH